MLALPTEAGLRKKLKFNDDGTLWYWSLHSGNTGFELVALPEEFGTVCTSGNLYLSHNQLSCLPNV